MALQFLAKIFGGNPVETIANVVDKFVHTKEEKEKARLELVNLLQSAEDKAQEQVTVRHQSDMTSDSWLSKNIRPLIFVFSLFMVTLFAFTDGNVGEFEIQPEYIELYKLILGAAVSFYFIGRTIEKINKMRNDNN